MVGAAVEFIERLQNLFQTGPKRRAFRQVHPANCSTRVDQELGRPSDIAVPRTAANVQKIVAPDDFRVCVGKKRIREAHLLTMRPTCLDRVNTDCDHANTARFKIR